MKGKTKRGSSRVLDREISNNWLSVFLLIIILIGLASLGFYFLDQTEITIPQNYEPINKGAVTLKINPPPTVGMAVENNLNVKNVDLEEEYINEGES